MRVLLLARYGDLGASSRVRFLQYLGDFEAQGWTVEVRPLFSNAYLKALYSEHDRWRETVLGYVRRLHALVKARAFDIVIIEKELFPFLPAIFESLLERLGIPYVADYDDALFHRYDLHSSSIVRRLLGRKIDLVMRKATLVVAGNEYLADRARSAGARRIEIIPTVVDERRYQPVVSRSGGPPVVGWIGTPSTSHYLESLLPEFERLRSEMPVRFVAIGAREADFVGTLVETWPWAEDTEVSSIQQFDIGIMPLQDSPWERGKCGYKLIQYMACGLPVIASSVGVNNEIVIPGENGLLADTREAWGRALRALLHSSEAHRMAMGQKGRERVVEWYSRKAQAPRLIKAVRAAVT